MSRLESGVTVYISKKDCSDAFVVMVVQELLVEPLSSSTHIDPTLSGKALIVVVPGTSNKVCFIVMYFVVSLSATPPADSRGLLKAVLQVREPTYSRI